MINSLKCFAQRFHYLKDPFYKFFALNLIFQDTSYSFALKYLSFLFKFFSVAFYIKFWFKISKICPKISQLSLEGTMGVTAMSYIERKQSVDIPVAFRKHFMVHGFRLCF